MAKVNILLVDDNPEYRKRAAAALSGNKDLEAFDREDTASAIHLLRQTTRQALHLVITDHDPELAEMNGIAVAEEAKKAGIANIYIHNGQPQNVPETAVPEGVILCGKMSANELLQIARHVAEQIDEIAEQVARAIRDERNSDPKLN